MHGKDCPYDLSVFVSGYCGGSDCDQFAQGGRGFHQSSPEPDRGHWIYRGVLSLDPGISIGIAYAIWSGAGIILLAIVGAITFREIPDLPAVIGMGLIISGVIVIHVFSKTVQL